MIEVEAMRRKIWTYCLRRGHAPNVVYITEQTALALAEDRERSSPCFGAGAKFLCDLRAGEATFSTVPLRMVPSARTTREISMREMPSLIVEIRHPDGLFSSRHPDWRKHVVNGAMR